MPPSISPLPPLALKITTRFVLVVLLVVPLAVLLEKLLAFVSWFYSPLSRGSARQVSRFCSPCCSKVLPQSTGPTFPSFGTLKHLELGLVAEYYKVAVSTAIGITVMGFIGFFVKLIFIPINNIIVGSG
nr:uncharacterized protein LOC112721533 [Arachis hypogaea]